MTSLVPKQRCIVAIAALFCALISFSLNVEKLIIPSHAEQAKALEEMFIGYAYGGSSGVSGGSSNPVRTVHTEAAKMEQQIQQAKGRLAKETENYRKTLVAKAIDNKDTISRGNKTAAASAGDGTASSPGNSLSSAYRNPVPDNLSQQQKENLPIPVRIMEQYKQWHGVDVLRSETLNQLNKRKYAVGFYVCPLSAGNRLHEFFNYMLWAVATNRTLLWKYYDKESCELYAPKLRQDPIHCVVANRLQDCSEILERAPWIPSYDEFTTKLDLHENDVELLPRWLNNPKFVAKNPMQPSKTGVDTRFKSNKIVLFPRRTNVLDYLNNDSIMKTKLQSTFSRKTVKGLFSLGINFLYGMLHRYSFDFTAQIQATVPSSLFETTSGNRALSLDDDFTVALHSRHNDSRIDGCDINNERHCLEKVLKKNANGRTRKCRVAVMADRTCTISRLTEWLTKDKNCIVEVAEHEAGNGTYAEHGPFAGSGYFQDLALASVLTRDAIVGSELHGGLWRSSSLLLMELVDYHKRMEAHFTSLSDLHQVTFDECMLPRNKLVCNKGWGEC